VHTVSEYSRSRIQDWLSTPEVSVVNVGNGVSDVFRDSGPVEGLEIGTFIYVGNLKPHKNAHVIFEALKLRPNYRVMFVTADHEDVQRTAADLGVRDRVCVLSGISDVRLASLYRSSAGLLFPSLMEGFGLPPLEALLSGCPVAYSTDCVAARDVVGQAGSAVADSRSAEAWGAAMDGLVASERRVDSSLVRLKQSSKWDHVAENVRSSLMMWMSR
jgi:glycosyltransferase involved in cell wall biosynthesis